MGAITLYINSHNCSDLRGQESKKIHIIDRTNMYTTDWWANWSSGCGIRLTIERLLVRISLQNTKIGTVYM